MFECSTDNLANQEEMDHQIWHVWFQLTK